MTFANKDLAVLSGRVDGTSTDYPLGSFRDESSEGADDGTPYVKEISKDLDGFKQAILALGGYTDADVNGVPDTAVASEILDALLNQVDGGFAFYKATLGPDVVRTSIGDDGLSSFSAKNTTYQQRASLENGALSFLTGTIGGPGDTSVKTRVSDYTISLTSTTTSDGVFTIEPAVVLTGIPASSIIHGVTVAAQNGSQWYSYPCTAETSDSGGDMLIIRLRGVESAAGMPSTGTGRMFITYDPSLVD